MSDETSEAITPTLDGDVLAVLARADEEFTPGEVHALIGEHSLSGVRKALHRLTDQGIVLATRRGNAMTYRFNHRHLAAEAIIALASLNDAFMACLRGLLEDFEHEPEYAAVFGSAARGQMKIDSDIDVFLVRPDGLSDEQHAQWDDDVHRLAEDGELCTGNQLEVLQMSASEVRTGLADELSVLADIQAEGLHLCGPSSYWRRAGG